MVPINPKSTDPTDPDPLDAASISPLDEDSRGDEDSRDDDGPLGGLPDALRERLESLVPELVKKTFAAGMGAVSSTEDGIRRVTRDMKLPKDVAGYLLDTAGNTKDEFMRILAREVREFLQTVNLSEEIAKMLTLLSFEIKTEIRFIPNDEKFTGVQPDVKASVRLKRADDKAADGKAADGEKNREEDGQQSEGMEDDNDDAEGKPRRRRLRRRR